MPCNYNYKMCVPTYNSESCIIFYLKLADITKFHFVSKEINRIIIIMKPITINYVSE